MYCKNCGSDIDDRAVICVNCGVPTHNNPNNNDEYSDKNGLVTLLLCIFVGCLGIHRFYVGKIGTGILMLITGGLFGIWTIVDIVMIVLGKFRDNNDRIVKL